MLAQPSNCLTTRFSSNIIVKRSLLVVKTTAHHVHQRRDCAYKRGTILLKDAYEGQMSAPRLACKRTSVCKFSHASRFTTPVFPKHVFHDSYLPKFFIKTWTITTTLTHFSYFQFSPLRQTHTYILAKILLGNLVMLNPSQALMCTLRELFI